MTESISTNKKRVLDVLRFWHSIEFFTPFNLDEVSTRSNIKYRINAKQLQQRGNSCLPWQNNELLQQLGGSVNSDTEYRYTLYLLPFNKNLLTKVSRSIFSPETDEIKCIEYAETVSDEGETCFAKITLNSKGQPLLTKLSISTMPWALGKLQDKNFTALENACSQDERNTLKNEIRDLLFGHQVQSPIDDSIDQLLPPALKANTLSRLFDIFLAWAGWKKNFSASVLIEISEVNFKSAKTDIKYKNFDNKNSIPTDENQNIEEEDDDEKMEAAEELAILNSFYIEDLEKTINDISNSENKIIQTYITGIPEKQKIDLYSACNQNIILEKLQPSYLSSGRWPADTKHFMSLMQQFAINACLSNNTPLFSINGPPGTGKTTLLQEIIAENIVQRTRALAQLEQAKDAFTKRISVRLTNQETCTVNILKPSLTGYEMVILSSNNTAVENISKELPLKAKLASSFQTNCRFLEPVAARLFAKYKKGKFEPILEKNKPWGLIAAALGNSKNRDKFVNRIFFTPPGESDKAKNKRRKDKKYLTIYEWCFNYRGISFANAKKQFAHAEKTLSTYLKNVKSFAEHYQQALPHLHELTSTEKSLTEFKERYENVSKQVNRVTIELEQLLKEENQYKEDLQNQLKNKPMLITKLRNKPVAISYQNLINTLQIQYNTAITEKIAKKNELKVSQEELVFLEQECDKMQKDLKELKKTYHSLLAQFPDIILPPTDENLEALEVQKQALWQSEQLNQLRSEVFIAALNLHQAWLAEVYTQCNFKNDLMAISNLLKGNRPINPSAELSLWQNLFMWIPVISSTFASFAGQFANLSAQSIGWVLIDEAGQAIPQAAVGALWRAKRALIVGDPLQIEPVFTTTPELVNGFAQRILHDSYDRWLPTLSSVQKLADDANWIGAYTEVMSKRVWIGSPLRVHRRCGEPMFSIANEIAYDNKMLQAKINKEKPNCILGDSCWFDVPGEAVDKQYVVEQGLQVLNLLIKLYVYEKGFPELYVIAPFKKIKYKLHELIQDLTQWKRLLPADCKPPAKSSLERWVKQHIGTIHTFQGKEAKIVFLVLGVDSKNQGAANWASSKPNLLNVALTRAKENIYLIGDYGLWSDKPYFSDLASILPVKRAVKTPISNIQEFEIAEAS